MLKPKVIITCPKCGVELRCQVREVNDGNASWAFTEKSFAHLQAANCVAPIKTPLLGEGTSICKEAA